MSIRFDVIDATGALNRIIKTPLPLAYSRHTNRALTLWCGTLPLVLADVASPFATVLATTVISWLVLGTEAIGQLIEQRLRCL